MRTASAILCAFLFAALAAAWADATINPSNRWAWGSSTGWVNCRTDSTNGAVIGEYYCSGYFYSVATGWISLGDGSPTNGVRYSNVGTEDWGVNHDGEGSLRGYGWSDEIGWIHFEDIGHPTIDLKTGNMSGHMWSESEGWIGFTNGSGYAASDTMAPGADEDGDGIPDAWERDQTGGTNTLHGGTHDEDGDGFTDEQEHRMGTNPQNSNDFLRVTEFELTDGTNVHVTWASETTRAYILERNDDTLTNSASWQDSGLGVQQPDSSNTTTRTVQEMNITQLFFRVKAKVPLVSEE